MEDSPAVGNLTTRWFISDFRLIRHYRDHVEYAHFWPAQP